MDGNGDRGERARPRDVQRAAAAARRAVVDRLRVDRAVSALVQNSGGRIPREWARAWVESGRVPSRAESFVAPSHRPGKQAYVTGRP